MITEIADLRIKAGSEAEFEAGFAKAVPLFARARGCHGAELRRSIETPQRYLLTIQWETLENHIVDFRESEDFTTWRGHVGRFFASPPVVEHFTAQ